MRSGEPGKVYSEFAAEWGRVGRARVPSDSVFGWCSWYQYRTAVTPADIEANLASAAQLGAQTIQIDDGYQAAIGDWLRINDTSSDGMAPMAAAISAHGADAGIWTAPFIVGESSELWRQHSDWIARNHAGELSQAMLNPEWDSWTYTLDTTRAEVLDHLRHTFASLRDQGYRYHKIDFCYAAALKAVRSDRTKTRAESLRMGLDAVRDGIGDDAFLLGCGCPFGPAVGVVDAMRVSADVAADWEPPHWSPAAIRDSMPSALNAIMASVLRAPLHRRVSSTTRTAC